MYYCICLPELPCTFSVSRHQRQSSSHVKLPPKQRQHFTVCHRSTHPICQHGGGCHGYALVLATYLTSYSENQYQNLFFVFITKFLFFVVAAGRGNVTGSSQTGDALGKALASVSRNQTRKKVKNVLVF